MATHKSNLIILFSVGLLFLGACSKGDKAREQNSSAPSPTVSKPASSPPPGKMDHPQVSKGGQVVKSGAYHLEFLAEKKDTGTRLYFYLQRIDNHQAVENANITAQVKLPQGKEQTLALKYDPQGKHYTVLFPVPKTGQYPVKITANIKGEKIKALFTFNQ
jgi:hypothetical protein